MTATMTSPANAARYGLPLIVLHWLTLALLVAVYATMELRGYVPRGPERAAVRDVHYILGLTVLALVPLRLILRMLGPTPPITPPLPAWQARAAGALHVILYLFMIGMPIAGWFALSAGSVKIPFWGLELPALIGPDKAMADSIEDVHQLVGRIGYALIGLHALAALVHHYWTRDTTLRRMLPGA